MNNLFENNEVLVEVNESGEIFVTSKVYGKSKDVTLRISPYPFGELFLTTREGYFLPNAVNGLGGFRLVSKDK